jgi:MFS family permease
VKKAVGFVLLMGLVSLLADVTYEGARGILGPFFQSLGATAALTGTATGLGEGIAYAGRLVSGALADSTGAYWTITALGYVINLLAVPALAWAGSPAIAAALVVAERAGKALRAPARDTLLAHAAAPIGAGRTFGLHELLDQIGAVAGPVLMAVLLQAGWSYSTCFVWLLLPATAALGCLSLAYVLWSRGLQPNPRLGRERSPRASGTGAMKRASFLFLLGFAASLNVALPAWSVLGYHLSTLEASGAAHVAALYALAMAADAAVALPAGYSFDRYGFAVLHLTAPAAAAAAILGFLTQHPATLAGAALLWGLAMGLQETALKAAVPAYVAAERRATGFGALHAAQGFGAMGGGLLMGCAYEIAGPAAAATLAVLAAILGAWSLSLAR